MNSVTVLLFKMNHSCIKYLAQWWALRPPCGPRGHAPECHRAASASDVVRVRLPVPSVLSPASPHFPLYGPHVYRRVMTLPRVESLRAWPYPFWLPGSLPVAPAAVPAARTMLCDHLFFITARPATRSCDPIVPWGMAGFAIRMFCAPRHILAVYVFVPARLVGGMPPSVYRACVASSACLLRRRCGSRWPWRWVRRWSPSAARSRPPGLPEQPASPAWRTHRMRSGPPVTRGPPAPLPHPSTAIALHARAAAGRTSGHPTAPGHPKTV